MSDNASAPVTLLFTDIEGSTRLWEDHPEAMRAALRQHDDLLRACIESHGGRVFKTVGDAFCAAFLDPRGGLDSVLASQQWLPALALTTSTGALPLKVRMALHTGVVEERDGDYFGQPLNRVARLLAAGHGGQVLLSAASQELVRDTLPPGASLRFLGEHRLRDLGRPEAVYQLLHPKLPADFPPLRSLDNPELKHNLPQQVTSFVGRDAQIAEVKGFLENTRLLTLTGSGGSGKTRLALQVAADLLDGSGDGVWLVELASLIDPDLVPSTVASALNLQEQPGKLIQQTLIDHLKAKQLLLILDNCEHLLDACAKLADALLRHCPRVLVLATSREGLGIAGELTYRVPSLSLPDPKQPQTPESLSHFEAVRLFIERAQFHQPQFAVTSQNAPALASVCQRLDGIPLAIELAAARVRSLSVEEINARLDQRFRLLTGGSRTALPRQQTLRSLIDWSYDLLNEVEKALLCRLSVFQGGWTLEAAEAVCAGEPVEDWEALDLLASLLDKNLLAAEEKEGATRYRLLETVRQYARDLLLEDEEGEYWRDRHLAHYAALSETAEPELWGPDQQAWLDRLEIEHDNLRAALEWSAHGSEQKEDGLRICASLTRFWRVRGYLTEGQARCRASLAHCEAPGAARAAALNTGGHLALRMGELTTARELHEKSLLMYRDLGVRRGVAVSLSHLGIVLSAQGDHLAARAAHEESLATFRDLDDLPGLALLLNDMSGTLRRQGDDVGARALLEESLARFRDIGDRFGVAIALHNLGTLTGQLGDHAAARNLLAESLTISQQLGDRLAAGSLEALAVVVAALGRPLNAVRLLGLAQWLQEEVGLPAVVGDRESYDRLTAATRAVLAEEGAFDAAWAEGRKLTLEQAVALALESPDA